MKKGSTYLAKSFNCSIPHLFIIITDPTPLNVVVVVNISSVVQGIPYDKSCVLGKGDHDFIKRSSYVFYKEAKERVLDEIKEAEKNGTITRMKDLKPDILKKIQNSSEKSDFFPPRFTAYKKYF